MSAFILDNILGPISPLHRLDSLVGLFAAGCQPSSTNDPFGLRRISYGLVSYLFSFSGPFGSLQQVWSSLKFVAYDCLGPSTGGERKTS